MIGIIVGISLSADITRKNGRVGERVALSPDGLVSYKPAVHLNVRGQKKKSRLNDTRQICSFRNPNFVEGLL